MNSSSDFIRCPKCGSKVYGMQVHNMDLCEKIRESKGLFPQETVNELKEQWQLIK